MIISIGILGILASIYLAIKGSDFNEYFLSFITSFALVGSAFINRKQKDN